MRALLLVTLLMASTLLTACSGIFSDGVLDYISSNYQKKDNITSNVDQSDPERIFVGSNQSIRQVSSDLQAATDPNQVSKLVNDKQVLIYDDYFVNLTKDQDKPSDTLIEVASYNFVRENYRPDFFDGLFTYYMLSQILNTSNWAQRQQSRCLSTTGTDNCYQGYNQSNGHFKGPGSKPLFRSSTIRGGGPNAGK